MIHQNAETLKAKITKCKPCEILDDYEYNEMYYDSSSSYYSDEYATFGGRQPKKENVTFLSEFNIETQFHCPTRRTFIRQRPCQLRGLVE